MNPPNDYFMSETVPEPHHTETAPVYVEREAPADVQAERVLIGACLLEVNYYNEIAEKLEPKDFYLDSHLRIFRIIGDLVESGSGVDIVTLVAELTRTKQVEAVGGVAFIASLTEGLPRRVVITDYIALVKQKSQLRQMIQLFNLALVRAQDQTDTPLEILEDAEGGLLAIAQEANVGKLRTVAESVEIAGGVDPYLKAYTEPERKTGLQTGFIDYDRMTGGLQKAELTIWAARPSMGKTALAMNLLENVCCGTEAVAAFFSLEMSRASVERRFMASRARVDVRRAMEGFYLSNLEKEKLSRALGDLVESKIFIDDSAVMTPVQMRAKARRLKQREGRLDLCVCDYLQLLTAGGRTGNRQEEIAMISRSLKAMSKELETPVVALAQLNRSPEQRQDKRPVLSDLRECLSKDSTFLFTSNGVQYNIALRMNTYSLNKGKIETRPSDNIPKRSAKVVNVRTRSGREITCTPNHAILTDVGWVKAKDLTAEHSIAAVRKVDCPPGRIPIPEARWIGRMLGNGSMVGYSSPSFVCSCADVAKDFCDETQRLFGLIPKPHKHASSKVFQYDITAGPVRTSAGNQVKDWMRQHDLWGKRAPEKVIPDWFMEQADDDSIANLVGGLVETDGSVFTTSVPMVKYSTTSKTMAWQVMWCLSRLGIFAKIDEGQLNSKAKFVCYSILIQEGTEVERFRSKVSLVGRKGRALLAVNPSEHGSNHGDRLGVWVSRKLRDVSRKHGLSWRELGYRDQGKRISQKDLSTVLATLSDRGIEVPELAPLVNDYIFWDRFKRIEDAGTAEVFDRSVPGPNNFVANGIVVHNSGQIEQDGDIIGFIHRPEYYDRDNEDLKGIAEMIIGKQRNGPTGVIKMAFDGSLTRFDNLARS